MAGLNNFRLSHETTILFVLSYEYNLPFSRVLDLYKISEKLFWAYQDTFANMSKMGVRKASQLSKIANRIYKDIHGIKDKKKRKVEIVCTDEEGLPIYLEDGTQKVEKHTITEHEPVVLDDYEQRMRDILTYYITKGYSNGDVFYTDEELMDRRIGLHNCKETIKVDGEIFSRTSKVEFLMERYFPDIKTSEYRKMSTRQVGELIDKVEILTDDEVSEAA